MIIVDALIWLGWFVVRLAVALASFAVLMTFACVGLAVGLS